MQFADDLMERNLGGRGWDPEPADHTTAAPLSPSHKSARSAYPNNVPVTKLHTRGQVYEIAKRFSFASPVSTRVGSKGTSKIPVAAFHHPSAGTPMKATGTTAEMTKSFVPTTVVSRPIVIPRGDEQSSEEGVQIRSGQRSAKMRPASCDASLIFNGNKEGIQQTRSSKGSEKGNGQHITVRERTKRWEARGGGLPSSFATLPKSFRHSVSSPPAGTP